MTVEELQARLDAAEAATGQKFAMTIGHVIDLDHAGNALLMRYWRPDPYAWPKSEAVEFGTFDDCMDALGRYVAEHATVPAIAAE